MKKERKSSYPMEKTKPTKGLSLAEFWSKVHVTPYYPGHLLYILIYYHTIVTIHDNTPKVLLSSFKKQRQITSSFTHIETLLSFYILLLLSIY